MDIEQVDGAAGPYFRVRIGDGVAVVGPRTRANPRRFAEALIAQLGAADMTSDAFRLCGDIEQRAKALGAIITPKLPGMVTARLLIGLAAVEADLQRLTDCVEGALASLPQRADGVGDN